MSLPRRRAVTLLGLGLATLALSGCGRKSRPSEPDDTLYPRHYPFTPYPAPPAPAPDAGAAPESGATTDTQP